MLIGEEFNEALHRRIEQAIDEGSARVVAAGEAPEETSLVDRLLRNAAEKKPLLSGARLYRGTKDPDVDTGTFMAGAKHATPAFHIAVGYAQTANSHIGMACKETAGIGMLAEYDLPEDAVFYRNFGFEDSVSGNSGLTVKEAEQQLQPLVDACLQATSQNELDRTKGNLHSFIQTSLYELALPADQKPARQWVVQDDGRHGLRFLEHEDRGPLARVMIDVLRARKSAIDDYHPARVGAYMRRANFTEMEEFSPGVASALRDTVKFIGEAVSNMRARTFETDHDSLSGAIAWRRESQQAIRIGRLSNSGTAIEHDDPKVRLMPLLESALGDLESAVHHHKNRPKRDEILAFLDSAKTTAEARERQKSRVDASKEHLDARGAAFDSCKASREEAAVRGDALEREHASRMNAGFVSRLLYRFGEAKLALEAMRHQEQRVSALGTKMEETSTEWRAAKVQFQKEHEEHLNLSEKAADFEERLRAFHKAGDLDFVAYEAREKISRLDSRDWNVLHEAALRSANKSDECIALGHDRAALFKEIATCGLDSVSEMHFGKSSKDRREVTPSTSPVRVVAAFSQEQVVVAMSTFDQSPKGSLVLRKAAAVSHMQFAAEKSSALEDDEDDTLSMSLSFRM